MLPRFEPCVGALVDTLVRQEAGAGDVRADAVPVTRFVLATMRDMPDYLRPLFWTLTLFFDLSSLPRYRRPFHALDPEARARQIERWSASRLGFKRSMIAFFKAFATLGFYSEIYRQDDQEESHVMERRYARS